MCVSFCKPQKTYGYIVLYIYSIYYIDTGPSGMIGAIFTPRAHAQQGFVCRQHENRQTWRSLHLSDS